MEPKYATSSYRRNLSVSAFQEILTDKHKIKEECDQTPLRQKNEEVPLSTIRSEVVQEKDITLKVSDTPNKNQEAEDIYQVIFKNSVILHFVNDQIFNLNCKARILKQNLLENDFEVRNCLKRYEQLCEKTKDLRKIVGKSSFEHCHGFLKTRQSINQKCSTIVEVVNRHNELEDARYSRHLEREDLVNKIKSAQDQVRLLGFNRNTKTRHVSAEFGIGQDRF